MPGRAKLGKGELEPIMIARYPECKEDDPNRDLVLDEGLGR